MSEFISEKDIEKETRRSGLKELASQYFVIDDVEFLDEMDDEEEIIGYIYGRLLELGEDPEEVLNEFGVTERKNDEV